MSIGSVLVAGMGVVLCGHAAFNMVRSALTSRWPSTDGQIISTRIVDTKNRRGSEERVTYRYHVAGKPFVSDRVQFGRFVKERPTTGVKHASRAEEEADLAARYPANSPVVVYYDPKHPGESVLDRRPNWTVWPQFGIGVLFIVLALRT